MKYILLFTALLALCCAACQRNRATYSGQDISREASIIRDKDSKAASVQINTSGAWKLYAGPSAESIDGAAPLAEGRNNGHFPLAVPDSVRAYFLVVTPNGRAILSERHLPMTGGYNFRDLGGLRTKEGRYVKWGQIFRSDDLYQLTKEDLRYLSSIPLTTIVDFRSKEEIAAAPDKKAASVKETYTLSITPGNLLNIPLWTAKNFSAPQVDTLMMSLNTLLVTDPDAIAKYRLFFGLLQSAHNTPLLFHCSAGKDRTGMAAALVLAALGVDEEIILNDYLLSNVYLADKYAPIKAEYPGLSSLYEVKPAFLQAGLQQIKEEYGSIENFLTEVLHVDLDRMKALYLY
jgi:protein-tyrosine phosphatase